MNSCRGCGDCKREFYDDVIHCLVSALDYRDHYTKGHSGRVGDMAYELAVMMGLDDNMKDLIHIAGHLHDIGKIGIADQILLKKGALTEAEWGLMKRHPQIGSDIVKKSGRLKLVGQIILQHHERWDGKGYPSGLKGEEIHIAARVIALCDTIDAMSSSRPYRENFDWDQVLQEIKNCSGTQFDPGLLPYMDNLVALWKKYDSLLVCGPHDKCG